MKLALKTCLLSVGFLPAMAQQSYELNQGWKCTKANTIQASGTQISSPQFYLSALKPAVVPLTFFTTQLANK